jgi:nitroreductase/FMN reductase [NAD(P)H]
VWPSILQDRLNAFFNTAVDAAIAIGAFVAAAEAVGLGCWLASAVRDRAGEVSDALGLPDHIFPVASLAVGWPAARAQVSRRLPLEVTGRTDRHEKRNLRDRGSL